MNPKPWWEEEWSPLWARHVVAKIAKRVVDEDGMPESQRVDIVCTTCGKEWRGGCTSGAPRNLVSRFATVHVHCSRDPLETPVPPDKPTR